MDHDAFYGEEPCAARVKSRAAPCRNRAYYRAPNGQLLCGVHCKNGVQLPKNPNAASRRAALLAAHADGVEAAAAINAAAGLRGKVICTALHMRHQPEDHSGYMKVFPNYRHGSRADGYGCPALSPMTMGPVSHGQPGLPPASCLENLHQGNKVFPSELASNGEPSDAWEACRLSMYQDPVPRRHKEAAAVSKPVYSVWRSADGSERHYTYVESRQFYCRVYEQFAEASAELGELRDCLDAGYNLQIIGYDGRPVGPGPTAEALAAMYADPSAPFGHELVLYSLLTLTPAEYPWPR